MAEGGERKRVDRGESFLSKENTCRRKKKEGNGRFPLKEKGETGLACFSIVADQRKQERGEKKEKRRQSLNSAQRRRSDTGKSKRRRRGDSPAPWGTEFLAGKKDGNDADCLPGKKKERSRYHAASLPDRRERETVR